MKKIPQDIIGDIAVLKFKRRTPWIVRKFKAWRFLKNHKNINTVLEKIDKFSGELRIPKTRYLSGEKKYETIYKENQCLFKFNINETYFSPRLSNERKIISEEVAKLAKPNAKILVCFAGIAPYPIAIAKQLKKQKKSAKIISNELNKKACEYAETNVKLNKLDNLIQVICDDARNLPKKLKQKFDIILMPRPNLKNTFLKEILKMSKKGTIIYYHGFGTKEEVLNEIKRDTKNKIGKIKIRKAGDIGPHVFRWQATFKVKSD
jgi:tRNA (guanine37-N1)-methyltransferase